MAGQPLAWMPARSYGRAFDTGRPIGVAVHCTESDNGSGTAESLAGPNWFGGPAGTSAHKMFDRNSGVEMVRRSRISYHAGPKGNVCAIAYEFCGKAGWSREKWHAPEQLRMLNLAAPHIADDLRAAGAPARWLSLAQLANAARTGDPARGGLFTHNDIRLALGGTTHTDPGKNFPYAYLLERVRAELSGTTETEKDWFDMATADELGVVVGGRVNDALEAHLAPVRADQGVLVENSREQTGLLREVVRSLRVTDDRLNVGLRELQTARLTDARVRAVVEGLGLPDATVDEAVTRVRALFTEVVEETTPEPEPAPAGS